MSEGGEQENQRGLNRIVTIDLGTLCLREESKKTLNIDSYNRLRYPMSEGGEQDIGYLSLL